MKISKWPFFVAKIWQTTSTDQQIRKGGSQKNTRKLRMQGGRYETKKDGKGGRAPSLMDYRISRSMADCM